MLVLGVGIGLSMQVLTIIVQNTVEYRDLGVATSGVTFFRTMGSSFGRPSSAPSMPTTWRRTSSRRSRRPAPTHQVTTPRTSTTSPRSAAAVIAAYADTLHVVFASAIPVAVIAFVVALFLKQVQDARADPARSVQMGPGFAIP
jgi:hypothetical protein